MLGIKKPISTANVSFVWPKKDGTIKTFHFAKGAIVAFCALSVFSVAGVVTCGSLLYDAYQEQMELDNYRAQYGVYTEKLQKLMADNEKMQKELAQVAALEKAVRTKLAKDGDGVPQGEIDKESQRLDNEGKGSGNSTADKLDILAVQEEITAKRIAYKKENLYNMLNELSNVGDGTFGWPLDGGEISSFYGYRADPFGSGGGDFHPGLDIAQSYGSPVKAACAGTVEQSGWNGGYGRYIRIDHGNGTETAYGHMSALVVEPGQKVTKGQVIGFVGSSGASTGPHLHFEVLKGGNTDNPLAYVNPK